MNPTVFGMRHPITTLMLVVALISGGGLAYSRMRVDIFPSLHVPKIYVFLDYVGMSPDQIEGFIVNQLELYFQYVDGIQDIDTRNIQQVSLCELSFFPGTDMGQAMAQVVAMSDRSMSWMPKGTLPPMIMRMDAGSVPVGYLVFESKETSLGAMGDLAQNIIRPLVQKSVPWHCGHLTVRAEHALDHHQCRSAEAAHLQLAPEGCHRLACAGQHDHSGRQHLYQRFDAGRGQQCHRGRYPKNWRHPGKAGPKRLHARPGNHPGRYRYHVRVRAGERQEVCLLANYQERYRLDADGGRRRPQIDATLPRRSPEGRYGQFRVR